MRRHASHPRLKLVDHPRSARGDHPASGCTPRLRLPRRVRLPRGLRWLPGWLTCLACSVFSSPGWADEAPESPAFFEKHVRPVLVEHCHRCHGPDSQPARGNLRVDRPADLLRGGALGPAIVPGRPAESLLWQAISHTHDDLRMPKGQPQLAPAVIERIRLWIAAGANWPDTPDVATPADGFDLAGRIAEWNWIWQPPTRPEVPTVRQTDWPAGDVDRFLLARLEEADLSPAPAAPPAAWLRRVHFALVGLPPTPGELDTFLRDSSPRARERVVDQLLASPEFGVRWARHWLDLVRYAESRGHESDFVIPNAHEYRDYVVRALNADLPYNHFVQEHLAGDLLPVPRLDPASGRNESLLATGWAYLGEEIHAPVDTRLDETERIDNRLDVFSKTFLGLTLACARCHDHKFDALAQSDYYALAGLFLSTGQRLARFESWESERQATTRLQQLAATREPRLRQGLAQAWRERLISGGPLFEAAIAALQTPELPPFEPNRPVDPASWAPGVREALARLASERKVDPRLLLQWVAGVGVARVDPDHPWHAPVQQAVGQAPTPPAPALSLAQLPEAIRVVVDAGTLDPASRQWSVDGWAYGDRPLPGGSLRLDDRATPGLPALRLLTLPAIATQLDWRRMELAPGTEREPTVYGGWKRDGATWRTPKFPLGSGRLHYLVRGAGRLLAAVDSQRLVTGPIHTGLVREWGFQERWHWVSHDLSPYAGHRVAVEFSPHDEFDSAIALVVEAEQPPALPATVGGLVTRAWLGDTAAGTPAIEPGVAGAWTAWQRWALAACDELAQPAGMPAAVVSEPTAAALLSRELARWLLRQPELLTGTAGEWPATVTQSLREWQADRVGVLESVRWQSRTAPAMVEGNGVDEFLLVRGRPQRPRGEVSRRLPLALGGESLVEATGGSGRLALARRLTDPAQPLLARVLVNRIWQHLFGRGLVATVDNWGVLGARPSHPELIDHLAVTFVENENWSIKRLIRRLVLSSAFAMSSSAPPAAALERDPANRLWHHVPLRRLEGETLRDAILAVSGRLDRLQGGVSIPLHESQFIEARGLRPERGPLDGHGRRSLFLAARRNFPPLMLMAFDAPTPFTTTGQRNVSNVPGQMLFLMNDPFVHQQTATWAGRLLAEIPTGADPDATTTARIDRLFREALSRPPTAAEVEDCRSLLTEVTTLMGASGSPTEVWAELCHSLMTTKEFLFVR